MFWLVCYGRSSRTTTSSIILFHLLHKMPFSGPHFFLFVLLVHKFYSTVYSLHMLLILDVFYQFKLSCIFWVSRCLFYIFYIMLFYSNELMSLFPILINSFGSSVFSNFSKYSSHICVLCSVFIADSLSSCS